MRNFIKLSVLFLFTCSSLIAFDNSKIVKFNALSKEERRVIVDKGTERPFSGKYYNFKEDGTYTCKRCNAPLYKSESKFNSGCGWPSFDDEIKGAIKRVADADGHRVEILCQNCGAHLGHVFKGEGFTKKNIRHCVNSISLNFEPKKDVVKKERLQKAYFAGGCFWGVEYYMESLEGVVSVESGYMGGDVKNPTYRDVSSGKSGHLEVVEVTYNPQEISYKSLLKMFFEIHDPTQKNGQGPDIGEQYLSAVFTSNESEKNVVNGLIKELKANGYNVATKILKFAPFYKAEQYHQNYYKNKNKKPYCHGYVKRFK